MAETINEIKMKIEGTVIRIARRTADNQNTDEAENLLAAQLNRLVLRAQIEERKKR